MSYELKHHTTKTIEKGTHFPLGVTLTLEGVNFSIYSKNATEVFLLLFDRPEGG
jgi:pullulanase/glycogen debranching enzyme